jgi:hypothetical protein
MKNGSPVHSQGQRVELAKMRENRLKEVNSRPLYH